MKIKSFASVLSLVLVGVFVTSYVALAVSSGFGEADGAFFNRTLVDESTASATSSAYQVGGAEAATFLFASDGPNGSGNGTTTFSVEASLDGTTFYDYNMLVSNAANANSETLTRVGSVDITGTSTALYYMDLDETPFQSIRCISVENGTTTASCSIFIQY